MKKKQFVFVVIIIIIAIGIFSWHQTKEKTARRKLFFYLLRVASEQVDPRNCVSYLKTQLPKLAALQDAPINRVEQNPESAIAEWLFHWGDNVDAYYFLDISIKRNRDIYDLGLATQIAAISENPKLMPKVSQDEIQQLNGDYQFFNYVANRQYDLALDALPQLRMWTSPSSPILWKARLLHRLNQCDELNRFIKITMPNTFKHGMTFAELIEKIPQRKNIQGNYIVRDICLVISEGYQCNLSAGNMSDAEYLGTMGQRFVTNMHGGLWWDRVAAPLFKSTGSPIQGSDQDKKFSP